MPRLRLPLWLIAAAVLATSTASAAGLGPNRTRVRTTARSGGASAVVGKWKWGPECGAAYTIKGATPTWTRNATESYECGGTLQSASANTPAVGAAGAGVWGAAENKALNSADFGAANWLSSNAVAVAPVVTTGQGDGPDGSSGTADRIAFPAINAGNQHSIRYHSAVNMTAAAWVVSVYLRTESGTGTVYLQLTDGSATSTSAACAVSTSWSRCSATRTATAAAWYWALGPDSRAWTGQPTTQAATTVLVWGAQIQTGSLATPYIATAGSTVPAPADAPTVASGLTDGSNWCVKVTATLPAWTGSTSLTLAGFGQDNTANSMKAVLFTNGTLYFDIWDSGGTRRRVSAAHGFSANTEHSIHLCSDGGRTKLTFDGTLNAAVDDGGGTGVLASVPDVMIAHSYAGTEQINGQIRELLLCKSGNASRCK